MRMGQKLSWIVGVGVVAAALATGVVAGPVPASADPCGLSWHLLPSLADRNACAQAKATAVALRERQVTQAQQAALANRPAPSIPNYRPAVLWPEPDVFKESKQVPVEQVAGGPWRGANSLWMYGSVPNDDYTEWDHFYIFAKSGQNGAPVLQTLVLNGRDSGERQYVHVWTSPRATGTLTITGITPSNGGATPTPSATPPHPFPGPSGVVHFTTSSGQSGAFDLATQTWTFGS